jgi:hypothetical protein
VADEFNDATPWGELPIVCPHCGNHGESNRGWETNAWTPFKLVEEVVRSWIFSARQEDGKLSLVADTNSDKVDWESGTNLRFECMECFGQFPVPEDVQVDFE